LIIKKESRYFLLNETLKGLIKRDFFYAGIYLGKVKNGRFFPSFNLLAMIAEEKANKIIVNSKAEWLFICGRDILKEGIIEASGSKKKGDYALVLNRHGECLGFGQIVKNLDEIKEGVALRNILDVGDFLRKEKQ
jgi:ribosome biogenesis protein Nip4